MRRTVVALCAVLTLAVAGCGAQGGSPEAGRTSGSASEGSAEKGKSWAYDRILDGSATLGDMAVVAEDDVWVYGSREVSAGTREQFLLRHDGTEWREQSLPEGIGTDVSEVRLDAVGAPGRSGPARSG